MKIYKFTQDENKTSMDQINQFLAQTGLGFDQIDWRVTSASYSDPLDEDDIVHIQHTIWILVK